MKSFENIHKIWIKLSEMNKLLVSILIFYSIPSYAQDYLLKFSCTGASNFVDSVKVENLTTGVIISMNGDDILRLYGTVGITSFIEPLTVGIKSYPNPFKNSSTIQILPPMEGEAIISIFDFAGKPVLKVRNYLSLEGQKYKLSGLNLGCYFITVIGRGYTLYGKLLSMGHSDSFVDFEALGRDVRSATQKKAITRIKGLQNTVDMAYSAGDRLKFTGSSGIYVTIVTDVPINDKIITFNFIGCTDLDGNNYSTVQIGKQIWMAENLKTTKFIDGTSIQNVSDPLDWSLLSSPGYCWYNNDSTNNNYAILYNWYTCGSGQLCPEGWHHPTSNDWVTLINFLGGETVSGEHMKETGITHWISPNNADNSTGFTALPSGVRKDTFLPWNDFGLFDLLGKSTWFTASDEVNAAFAYWLDLSNESLGASLHTNSPKNTGFSVRCILTK
jgi:uncharacterized protein (TIGR02145 family)